MLHLKGLKQRSLYSGDKAMLKTNAEDSCGCFLRISMCVGICISICKIGKVLFPYLQPQISHEKLILPSENT